MVLYECLLGSRRVRGTSPVVALVKDHKAVLQQTLANRRKRGASNTYSPKKILPRFVRVNTLLTTVPQAIDYLSSTYSLTQKPFPNSNSNTIPPISPGTFHLDPHLPTVLHLPSKTNLHGDAFVESGKLILQDRSSCLTALVLDPPPGASCIDTCAAPGNKTLHCAALVGRSGSVAAFERSSTRLATLRSRVKKMGAADIISTYGCDFVLDVSTSDPKFAAVTHILIDPSCSGSGLVAINEANSETLNEHDDGGESDPNIPGLVANQKAIILHAMALPSASVIAYSTCSVYKEENEEVVRAVLNANSDWECVEALKNWPNRGIDGPNGEYSEFSSKVVRATFEKDTTNGFFVARFEKKKSKEGKEKKKSSKEGKEKKKDKESATTSGDAEVGAEVDTDEDEDAAAARAEKKRLKKLKKEKKRKREKESSTEEEKAVAAEKPEKSEKKAKKAKKSSTKE